MYRTYTMYVHNKDTKTTLLCVNICRRNFMKNTLLFNIFPDITVEKKKYIWYDNSSSKYFNMTIMELEGIKTMYCRFFRGNESPYLF